MARERDGRRRGRIARRFGAVLAAPAAVAVTLALAAPAVAGTVDVTAAPYGAVGDGQHNDRAAIQSAIDDVAARGGGTVVVPAGHTFLTGNLHVESGVTLQVDGTLKQSQQPGDYTFTPVLGHTAPGGDGLAWYSSWFKNEPFIFAGNAHDVAVTGHGELEMTTSPDGENATIHVIAIGLYRVEGFRVDGLRIQDNNAYNVTAWDSRHGTISNLVIDAVHTNTDGINVKDSQYVHITGNTIDNRDDGIILGSGWNDPRAGTWWQSAPHHGGSSHIEIDHNVDRLHPVNAHPVGKSISFIPWGTTAPDPRWTELQNISIHDNRFEAPQAIGCWCDNPYNGGGTNNWDHSAIKNVRIFDNTYLYADGVSNPDMESINWLRASDLQDDFGKLGTPEILNGDFEHLGTTYWSTQGTASASDGTPPPAEHVDGPPPRDEFVHAVQDQARSWGWFGYAQGNGARLYEGLGLNDGVPYRLTVDVRTGAVPARLFLQNVCTGEVVASRSVIARDVQSEQLDFRAAGTCSDYRIGVETASGGWALIDNAAVATTAQVINDTDPAVAYTGSWTWLGDGHNGWDPYWGPIGGDWHWGTSRGAAVTTTFTGTRAWLYAVRRTDAGTADIYVDGVYQRTVDLYHWAWVDHQVIYDTGKLAPGQHTLKLVTTGQQNPAQNPASTGFRTTFDAVVVEP
jgi:hypothetical protein